MSLLSDVEVTSISIFTKLIYWTGIFVVGAVASYFRRLIVQKVEIFVSQTIRKNFFTILLQKPFSMFNEQNSGSLSQQLNKDIPEIANSLTMDVSAMLRGFFFFIGGISLLLLNSPGLAFLSVFPISLFISIGKYYGKKVRAERAKLSTINRQFYSYTLERFKQIKSVKVFNAEPLEYQKFQEFQEKIKEQSIITNEFSAKFFSCLEFMGENVILIGGGLGVYILKLYPEIKVEDLRELAVYGVYSAIGFRLILNGYAELKKTSGLYSSIAMILEDPQLEQVLLEPHISETSLDKGVSISINSLCFTYPTRETPALTDINILINSGEILGIIGQSGHGKSTLIHLITALYPLQSGQIKINDIDIREKPQ